MDFKMDNQPPTIDHIETERERVKADLQRQKYRFWVVGVIVALAILGFN